MWTSYLSVSLWRPSIRDWPLDRYCWKCIWETLNKCWIWGSHSGDCKLEGGTSHQIVSSSSDVQPYSSIIKPSLRNTINELYHVTQLFWNSIWKSSLICILLYLFQINLINFKEGSLEFCDFFMMYTIPNLFIRTTMFNLNMIFSIGLLIHYAFLKYCLSVNISSKSIIYMRNQRNVRNTM
jgi:hypothetical protein